MITKTDFFSEPFQFLIGTIRHSAGVSTFLNIMFVIVSIPYRYDTTVLRVLSLDEGKLFQFLIGTIRHSERRNLDRGLACFNSL